MLVFVGHIPYYRQFKPLTYGSSIALQVDYRARAEQPTELKEIPHLTVPRRPNALDLPRSMNRNKNGLIHQQPE